MRQLIRCRGEAGYSQDGKTMEVITVYFSLHLNNAIRALL